MRGNPVLEVLDRLVAVQLKDQGVRVDDESLRLKIGLDPEVLYLTWADDDGDPRLAMVVGDLATVVETLTVSGGSARPRQPRRWPTAHR
ncbi:MAG: hypothetical protein IH888_05475 [Planctomycetes bacterium]|nr:hypothetical protein [Planctomycetota bacterium]